MAVCEGPQQGSFIPQSLWLSLELHLPRILSIPNNEFQIREIQNLENLFGNLVSAQVVKNSTGSLIENREFSWMSHFT